MRQLIQNLKTGETILENIPMPLLRSGHILIKSHCSLVSTGTEKMLVEFSKANLISKARQQPERVKQVFDKIKTDGLTTTLEAVFNKLDEPLPLGYCNAGEVIGVAKDVTGFKIGDRVASNGHHAEYVCVPKNLVAHIPDEVSYEAAAFTPLAAIGLQGIRLVNPQIGDTSIVIGLGLIGLLTAQLLSANGCNVIAFDIEEDKIEAARKLNINAYNSLGSDPVTIVQEFTRGAGADAVLITASSKSNAIIAQAAEMSRKRGKIVLVGVVGLEIDRNDFYKKELSFQVSCSYGPGRYDDEYEQKGIDYPLPYVRWTEKRNFEAVLNTLAKGQLRVESLISEKVDFEHYKSVYDTLHTGDKIASLLMYPHASDTSSVVHLSQKTLTPAAGIMGIIGSGNFTKMTLLPVLKSLRAQIKYIAGAQGVTSTALAKKYGIANSTTDLKKIIDDPEVDLIMITTRHDLHAPLVAECLRNGKNVFVEKPLALNEAGLNEIIDAYQKSSGVELSVGFNRRFSPFAQKAKQLIGNGDDINVIATVNAGKLPGNHWLNDPETGGGRIIGEACHFVDIISFFTGSTVHEVFATAGNNHNGSQDVIISMKYKNGSQGAIHYFTNGNKSYPKERIEIFAGGRNIVIDNFRKMAGYGFRGFSSLTSKQNKGHREQFDLLIGNLKRGGAPLIPMESIINTTRTTFSAVESITENRIVAVA